MQIDVAEACSITCVHVVKSN